MRNMKFLVIFASFILAVSAITDKDQWHQFKEKYGRDYRNLREEQTRFSIFQENLRFIEAHNEKYAKGETSYYMGVTRFTDLTPTEFAAMFNTTRPTLDIKVQTLSDVSASDVPNSIDWRDRDVVSEVKSQGNCGGCWAFAATGALEAAYAIKTGKHISLSEQNLIDCSTSYGNGGCSGGVVHYAFEYVVANGIETEQEYTYRGVDGTCAFSSSHVALKATKYVALPYDDESELKKAVGTVGPVAVSIDSSGFQFYDGGVLDVSSCTWNVDHAVLVVGYGEENGSKYWIVKNSWGADWGDQGFIKMARDKSDQCGIGLWAVYPVL